MRMHFQPSSFWIARNAASRYARKSAPVELRNAVLDTSGLLLANFDSSRKRRAAQHAAKTSFVPHRGKPQTEHRAEFYGVAARRKNAPTNGGGPEGTPPQRLRYGAATNCTVSGCLKFLGEMR
jgi:hypothetical protein